MGVDLRESSEHDYLCWDRLGQVRVEFTWRTDRGKAGTMHGTVVRAKRRALTVRELLASAGGYTGNDVVWLVPVPELAPGQALKPSDVIVDDVEPDGDGARYTALDAQLGKFGLTYRLTCRNLTLHENLRHTVTIERPTVAYTAAGAATQAFPTGPPPLGGSVAYLNLPARVQLLEQAIAEERGLIGFQGTHVVIVDRQLSVTNQDRVRWVDDQGTTRYLDILSYRDPERIDELPKLDCLLKV